jgi:hypothetical protein
MRRHLPKCQAGGGAGAHVVPNDRGGHLWLCGKLRAQGDEPGDRDEARRTLPLHAETLFDASEFCRCSSGSSPQ